MKIARILSFFLLASCCRVPDCEIPERVSERTGYQVHWERKMGCAEALTSDCMSLEETIQVALLRSPEIQILFEEVGIAEADFVNACLIANPVIDLLPRIPSVASPSIDLEIDAIQPFVSILLQPLRKKTAHYALEATKAQVTSELFSFIEQVGIAFYTYQAAKENLQVHEDIVEARFLAYDVAQKQFDAGNIGLLMKDEYKIAYEQSVVAHQLLEIDLTAAREELSKFLACSNWDIASPCDAFSPLSDDLACFALEHRFDLYAIWLSTNGIAQSMGLYDWWTYTDFGAGISYESDPSGGYTLGPGFSAAIPIFNYGQGDRMRVNAAFAASYQTWCQKRLEILQEVTTFQKGYELSKAQLDLLQNKILPTKEEVIDQNVRLYNFMNSGVYRILEAKVEELMTQMEINHARAHTGIYQLKLTRSLGGELP